MTPAARVQAAIEILDSILGGTAAERVLTGWARRSRFAGSGDRAAVRDHVFDALRCKRSYAALGGDLTGRGLMLGAIRARDGEADQVFTGVGHAPEPLTEAEKTAGRLPHPGAEAADFPDWLWPQFQAALGDNAEAAAQALRTRATVFLRVNMRATSVPDAIAALAQDGVTARAHPMSPTALEVLEGSRRIRQSQAYLTGQIELQDAASQAVVDALPLKSGMRVLDYCAGGGGKTLAMAARADLKLFAHDAAPERMNDLPNRAERAGQMVTLVPSDQLSDHARFDLVLCDVPCSGSGAWRRAPEGKWTLTQERLTELNLAQDTILKAAAALVAPGGVLAYATCSVLTAENKDRVSSFVSESEGWTCDLSHSWSLLDGADGFYSAHLTRA
jgi:16S rRNA (cytosine967-C5)-methyltransferase